MDSGYYAAMTGLEARTQALDTAAANLANAQTPGFRAEREFFRSVLLGPDGADSQLGETVNNYGLLGGDRLSMAQGALAETGNPLDLAIEGQGFFMVQTPNGPRCTRDGSFHRTPNGQLVTRRAAGALGCEPDHPDSARRSRDRLRWNGLGGGRCSGPRRVFDFPAGTVLTPEGANRYVAPTGATPVAATGASIHQGALEGANQESSRARSIW